MAVDTGVLELLVGLNEKNSQKYMFYVNDKSFPLTNVSITNSPIPVNEPTTRGGVYFSDKFAYKMKGTIEDLSVIPLLTTKMLGPSTDFGELKITTQLESDGKSQDVEIFANLTNSVQTPNSIELNMIIVKLEST